MTNWSTTEPRQDDRTTTPPCNQCIHNKEICEDELGNKYYWCDFDEEYLSEEYAISDIECDMFEQKLDDNETEKSSA